MRKYGSKLVGIAAIAVIAAFAASALADGDNRYHGGRYDSTYDGGGHYDRDGQRKQDGSVQLGPRPCKILEGM